MTVNPRTTPVAPVVEQGVNSTHEETTIEEELINKDTELSPCEEESQLTEIIQSVEKINLEAKEEIDEYLITDDDYDEEGNPIFPHELLSKLDEMVNKPKWIIPVLPKAELELLMDASIKLAKKGLDTKSEACQRFINDGMTKSYEKILLDEAVSTWKFEIHKYILKNTEKLLELCVVKLDQDWFPLLDLLAIALNPNSRFHLYNAARTSDSTIVVAEEKPPYAKPSDHRQPKGWVVDLVNKFGNFGGFEILRKRFCETGNLNVPIICALIKPFGLCAEVLSEKTVQDYLMPVIGVIKTFLDSLTDEVLKKESKTESKNEAITIIIKSMKAIVSRLPDQEELCKELEKLRLQMILRLLQVSPFNGKMNALNEINRVISSVSYYTHHRHSGFDEDEYLTHDMVAQWLQENDVLVIVLKDNLHQPQYVEKLEKIIRFTIKAKTLSLKDLDTIWMAQIGKHEAIVKNVHDLLAKLAWDFSAEQLDHLFSRFQTSWNSANKKQQEKLLELIRRLAEDDKEGVIAHKVLGLLWQLAHSDDLHTDIMDQALNAHIKILDYSCSQTHDRDNLKIHWINRCVEELRSGVWVIPALKHIRAICELFYEGSSQVSNPHVLYRNKVVENVQNNHAVVSLVAENLSRYMQKVRKIRETNSTIDPENLRPDGRYTHVMQIQERLDFLRFVLNDGKMWLCEPQAEQIWICLAINCVFPVDRDVCFKWFSKVMGDDPDLDPEITKQFFENNVLKIQPVNLNEQGLKCFERFFKYVNQKEGFLVKKRNGSYVLENTNLIGYDYLWKVIIEAPLVIANNAIEILKEVYTTHGLQLRSCQSQIHNIFIECCREKIKPSEKLLIESLATSNQRNELVIEEARKITLCVKALREYVAESDLNYKDERVLSPHNRSCRGKQICLYIRFSPQNRQIEDFEIWTHSHESIASIRRKIYGRLKMPAQTVKLDLYNNSELINQVDDRKLLNDFNVKDRTVFTIKFGSAAGSVPSSPDSSSDSSPPATPQPSEGPSLEAEHLLPGVILSKTKFANMLFSLGDLAIKFDLSDLLDMVLSLLHICPSDVETIHNIKSICSELAETGNQSSPKLENCFFSSSHIQVLYNLEVIHSLLLPSHEVADHSALSFQQDFILAGGVNFILKMFTKNNFLCGADMLIKRTAYTILLKISKLIFTAIAFAQITVVAEALQKDSGSTIAISAEQHSYAVVLQQAVTHIPNTYYEFTLRSIAGKLGQTLRGRAINHMPDITVIRRIQRICWSSAIGNLSLLDNENEDIHKRFTDVRASEIENITQEDIDLSIEAFETLTIALALCPSVLNDSLIREQKWHYFIIDLILLCKTRAVRITANEQCFLIASKCCNGDKPLKFFIQLLFTVRDTKVLDHPAQSMEYFSLLCRLLNYGKSVDLQLSNATKILEQELQWIKKIQHKHQNSPDTPSDIVQPELLEGHLGITKELLAYHSIQKRYNIGCEEGGDMLLMSLINDFLFPASKLEVLSRTGGDVTGQHVNPICHSSSTIVAALDLLVALSTNCVPNLRLLSESLSMLYYSGGSGVLSEWEYQPPIGPRPVNGFVGLKNAGATCYMNSVLQQLYMIPEIRSGVLSADIPYHTDEESEEEDTASKEILNKRDQATESDKDLLEKRKQLQRQQYNTKILSHVQAIFGHLFGSKLQFYIPKGFWRSFRLWGEPVNLREQHDAYEFFNTLVDNIDEGLKAAGYKTSCANALGGSFADQKICKQCPHRYSRETPFTAINVDVRNHHNLIDSLEQYVKGDLLEGANAYHCERCDKKVDTVKRMCIKKIPPVLAIQLKRFDYDWERDCAVKFNDYFEFPREFNLEPFTVDGLAKVEGEIIEDDIPDELMNSNQKEVPETPQSTVYRLMGVVVHSGQASGGHYYSYIIPRSSSQQDKWYKFDDGDVCECNMHEDEELKNQCFGGEYMGEAFDHMIKRRQKRWWNAYLLFYERVDVLSQTTRQCPDESFVLPSCIQTSVRKENIQFLHTRSQFSMEYFQFMRKLTLSSLMQQQVSNKTNDPAREELCLISLQLVCKFLFTVGFHTKKSIRGPANEWYDTISALVRQGVSLRRWFVIDVLLAHPDRIIEYLLECPVAEIRSVFGRIIVLLAHLTRTDGTFSIELLSTPLEQWQVKSCDPIKSSLSDYLLRTVLEVLHLEGSENNTRHVLQYFQLFFMYAGIGIPERKQLLDLGVLLTFIRLAVEDERGSAGKYQFAELSKLYSLVSVLIRSCDVSKYMKSSIENESPKANPYFESMVKSPIMEIPADVEGLIYTSNYVKKLLEESNTSEDTIHLMKFLSWECLSFSMIALSEVLFQISYAYTYELRPYLDILLHLLLMNDSWQEHRLRCSFSGVSDDREGLFDTIQRSKSHSHKRGYQCIKAIVQLTQNCELGYQLLMANDDFKEKWKSAVRWLGDELERRAPSAYNYSNWSPPTQSNETSNGYFLERSRSARFTYSKACEMFEDDEEADEEDEEEEEEEEEDSELVESLNQSSAANIVLPKNNRPSRAVHYTGQMSNADIKCPPYSEVVINSSVSSMELNNSDMKESLETSLVEDESDN